MFESLAHTIPWSSGFVLLSATGFNNKDSLADIHPFESISECDDSQIELSSPIQFQHSEHILQRAVGKEVEEV
ncbi:hypothetical protein Nepgr_017539 [Nepenthes gracilis]|uniref:Uncharacterized protein n=1 Tax=Nepenthes gracilis TaxID=150966 RepID=A0AAD3SQJ9_NEPGR|nr:hypothetical protein Nepgr_017539 [Nepenthes gracilis]